MNPSVAELGGLWLKVFHEVPVKLWAGALVSSADSLGDGGGVFFSKSFMQFQSSSGLGLWFHLQTRLEMGEVFHEVPVKLWAGALVSSADSLGDGGGVFFQAYSRGCWQTLVPKPTGLSTGLPRAMSAGFL